MSVYKVPQDVEAEDKLVGPLSGRQLIYIGIAAGFGYLVLAAVKLNILIAIIPMLPMAFFLLLGLWQSSHQPIEAYLAALVRFYFKSRTRIWQQSGVVDRVVIHAPKQIAKRYSDGRTRNEVKGRLKGLAEIMDSHGWNAKTPNEDGLQEAGMFEEDSATAQRIDGALAKREKEHTAYLQTLTNNPAMAKKITTPVAAGKPQTADPALSQQYTSSTLPVSAIASQVNNQRSAQQPAQSYTQAQYEEYLRQYQAYYDNLRRQQLAQGQGG